MSEQPKKLPKRITIGSVYKGKPSEDGRPSSDYIKISTDVELKKGMSLQLKSKAQQLQDLEDGLEAGRLSEETGEKIRARIDKIPDFVRFEIVLKRE